MSFTRWLSNRPGRSSRPAPPRKTPVTRRTFLPGFEALEQRWVPSTLTVTTTVDDGTVPGTLRYAVAHAGDGDKIVLDGDALTSAIILTQGELVLTQQRLTIETAAAGSTATISGSNLTRIFDVAPGAEVTLDDLIITGGNPVGWGGGIYNDGTLTLSDCTVSNNSGVYGGGIYNYLGPLTVKNSALTTNSTIGGDGGGIYNIFGTVTVTNSTVSGNSAHYAGGGIFHFFSTLTVSNSTVSGNSSDVGGGINCEGGLVLIRGSTLSGNSAGDVGGGIRNTGTVVLSDSTLSGNSAYWGGGIANLATLTVRDGSLSGNSATWGGGIANQGWMDVRDSDLSNNSASYGGGIYSGSASPVTISDSSLSGNSASVAGGGLYNNGGAYSGPVTVTNSTITGNSAPVGFGADVYNLGVLYVDSASSVGILDGNPGVPI